ncbi:hypothetical protein [Actinosynnema sp. NPDC023587]|uniref:hypothetical protein n=1 Tax=Actinosynnema sp. NPDC023587 TaxID=3154695 RepID=UPI0033CEA5D0
MAKINGLGWTTLSVDDSGGTPRDIRNDTTNFDFAMPRAVQDVTGVDKSAIERLLNLADFSINLNAVFNAAANAFHAVFKTVPSTSVARTVSLAIASQTLANECLPTDYQVTRAATGELTCAVPLVLADGTVPTWS